MSLINDALKKAQKQRTGEIPTLAAMPTIGGDRPVHIARRSQPPGVNSLLVKLGAGVGVLLIVVMGGMLLFRGASGTSTPATTTVADTPKSPMRTTVATVPPAAVPAASVSTFVVPHVTPAAKEQHTTPKAESLKSQPERAAPVPTVVATVEPPKVEPPAPAVVMPAAPPAKLEPRAINFIEAIRVAGIRASATDSKDSKVLMNDRVYRVGNTVEAEMGLRLVEITPNSLTFEDDRGGRYTRSF